MVWSLVLQADKHCRGARVLALFLRSVASLALASCVHAPHPRVQVPRSRVPGSRAVELDKVRGAMVLRHHPSVSPLTCFKTSYITEPLESFIHYPLAPKYQTAPFKNHPLQKHGKPQIKNPSFFEGGAFSHNPDGVQIFNLKG